MNASNNNGQALTTQVLQQLWFSSNLYKFERSNSLPVYAIDTPPPTVSGILHMGHVFSYCHTDFIARYKRMNGFNVFYPIGYDDNGLPTERLTEKIMTERAKKEGREPVRGVIMQRTQQPRTINGKTYNTFVEMCKEITEEHEKDFEHLFKSLCLSFDWSLKYQTISDNSIKVGHKAFNNLQQKGLVYTSVKPVYWDTVDQTALAQADIETKEMNGTEHNIIFTITDGQPNSGKELVIMTTRPELLPACCALMYHPDDERYNGKGVGKTYKITLCNEEEIEIEGINIDQNRFSIATTPLGANVRCIADEKVAMDKGTGLVMLCLFGDMQDVEWYSNHYSAIYGVDKKGNHINIQTVQKTKVEELQSKYIGKGKIPKNLYKKGEEGELSIPEARKFVTQALEENRSLICKRDKVSQVKCAERSGKPVEIINTLQYYINLGFRNHEANNNKTPEELKKATDGEKSQIISQYIKENFKDHLLQMAELLHFYPDRLRQRLKDWINGLNQDWCISRNRFSGVPIPNSNYVFDTWFVSSLSPKLPIQNLIEEKSNSSTLITLLNSQFNLRPQAHEIIRTWMFYTMAQAYLQAIDCIVDKDGTYRITINEKVVNSNSHPPLNNIHTNKVNDEIVKEQLQRIPPWKDTMLSGWCLARDKTKMSKSKGNVVEPLPMLEKYGVDSVRYWAASANLGVDTPYNEEALKNGQKLVKKLQNIYAFISQYTSIKRYYENEKENIGGTLNPMSVTEHIDFWILNKIQSVFNKYTEYFDKYNYASAFETIERFFLDDFCDNYIEIIKGRIYGKEGFAFKTYNINENRIKKMQDSAIYTVNYAFNIVLAMFAPFLPQTTDSLALKGKVPQDINHASIHKRGAFSFITYKPMQCQGFIEEDADLILRIIAEARRQKTTRSLSIKAEVKSITLNKSMPLKYEFDLRSVCNAFNCQITANPDQKDEIVIEV